MGSWFSKVQKCSNTVLGYGYYSSLFKIDYTPSFQQQFKNSTYTKIDNQKEQLIEDQKIRKSQYAFVDEPKLSQATQGILKNYLYYTSQTLDTSNSKWRIVKYQDGHFQKHLDKYIKKQGLIHVGTQICLPPKKLCNYQGGELFIIQNGNVYVIKADQVNWTHIILPLGIYHEIRLVKGTRISYTKQIYIKQRPNVKYNMPNKAPGRESILYN